MSNVCGNYFVSAAKLFCLLLYTFVAGGVAEISESKGVHRSMDVVHIRSPVLNRFFAASIKNGHIKVTAKKRKSNLPNEEEHSATQAANENKTGKTEIRPDLASGLKSLLFLL